jgi:hypothetical protein
VIRSYRIARSLVAVAEHPNLDFWIAVLHAAPDPEGELQAMGDLLEERSGDERERNLVNELDRRYRWLVMYMMREFPGEPVEELFRQELLDKPLTGPNIPYRLAQELTSSAADMRRECIVALALVLRYQPIRARDLEVGQTFYYIDHRVRYVVLGKTSVGIVHYGNPEALHRGMIGGLAPEATVYPDGKRVPVSGLVR